MISERIKALRELEKMSQKNLAEKLGITQQAVAKWEKGIAEPDIYAIKKMANIFNVSTDYLLEETNILDSRHNTLAADRKDGYDLPLTEDEKAMIDSVLAAYRSSKQAKKD